MSTNIGHWLRKTPQPVTLDVDGKKVAVPNTGGKWRDMVRTIEAMGGTKIAALDGAGNVIRAITLDPDDADEKKSAPEPENEIVVFAKLIAEAYEKGSKSNQPIIDNALSFVERLSNRLAAAERENDRLKHENHRLRAYIAENPPGEGGGEGDPISDLLAGVAAAAQQQQGNVTPIPKKAEKK